MESTLRIKNENPKGASLRIQYWNGKLPTYDSEKQRAEALESKLTGTDPDGNPILTGNEQEVVETLPDNFEKLKKAELAELATQRGIDVTADDTVATLKEKITASYPEAPAEPEEKKEKPAKEDDVIKDYKFKSGNLLQEQVLGVGSEKVITVSSDVFVTIKVDE